MTGFSFFGFSGFSTSAGVNDWWSSPAYLAEDVETGLVLGPAAIMDFSGRRYALYSGFWEVPEYAAADAATGRVRYASAIIDFSGGRYAG